MLKRENFILKSAQTFEFMTDLGFEGPVHSISEQPNATIISDTLTYSHKELGWEIILYNAYHPVDYGFELTFRNVPDRSEKILYTVLKEDQDLGQNYLAVAAKKTLRYLNKIRT